jgi:hypothetical protein
MSRLSSSRLARIAAFALLVVPAVGFAGGFKVSSFKKDTRNPGMWNVESALDGKPETAWMVDPEEDSVGSFIEVDVPAATVDKITIDAGYDKDDTSFKDYPRLKSARVEIFQMENKVGEAVIALEDKRGMQTIDLPDTKLEGSGRVRVNVQEVYPGQDYPNLALSDVRVDLKEFPAESLKIVDPAAGGEALMDKNAKTVWSSPTVPASITLSASGYGLASVGLQAGPMTGGRPKTVEITANDNTQTVTMEDKQDMQWFMLPVLVGYTGSCWGKITVKVIDAYAGPGVGLAEVGLNAATIEEF